MALDENAKAANIAGSVQQYFQDQLGDVLNSSAPAIDYGGGMPFNDAGLDQWVQVRLIAPARPERLSGPFASRAGGDFNARGQELYWVLNVNCFVRPANMVPFTNLSLWRVRDLVIEPFMPGKTIPVKDYQDILSTGGETIGQLFVSSIMEDRAVDDPARPELFQHNLVFLLRWTETWVP